MITLYKEHNPKQKAKPLGNNPRSIATGGQTITPCPMNIRIQAGGTKSTTCKYLFPHH